MRAATSRLDAPDDGHGCDRPTTGTPWRDLLYFGPGERRRPDLVVRPRPVEADDDDVLELLWEQTCDELQAVREFQGGGMVSWGFGSGGAFLSVYFGTLCGQLLINRVCRDDLRFQPSMSEEPGAPRRALLAGARRELYDARSVLSRTQAGFGHMVRVMWFGLMCWVALGIAAALGTGQPAPP